MLQNLSIKTLPVILLTIAGLFLFSIYAHAANPPTLFRYKNEQGTTVTSYNLPPEYVEKGYEIVTPKGVVLKVVPAAPTKEERAAMIEQQRSAEEQAEYDKRLLLKYGSLSELRKAQERKLSELEGKLTVLKGNLSNIKAQIESEQLKAANYERQGRSVPDFVLNSLEDLYGNLERTESLLKRREAELTEESKQFEYEMQRFKEIKGLP